MTNVLDLYNFAEEQGIEVYWLSLECAESLSYCDSKGDCFIAMNPWCLPTIAEEQTKLAHELGHCCTGAFYNRYATCDVRQKHENRADKWAIQHLIPKSKLDAAVADGHTEIWDLAEYFDVTENLMRKAICWYMHGNLTTDLYMTA